MKDEGRVLLEALPRDVTRHPYIVEAGADIQRPRSEGASEREEREKLKGSLCSR
jgi:hypothetical protein